MTARPNPYVDPLDAAFPTSSRSEPAADPAYLTRAEPRAARGGAGPRRPGPGAGGRGHGQDPRADDPARAHPGDAAGLAQPDPGRHLHQQGRARDEGAHRRAHRRHGRRACNGSARSTPSARGCCGVMPSWPGSSPISPSSIGRPAPSPETDPRSGEHRREALARAHARAADRRLEESRAAAARCHRRRRARLRVRQGPLALRDVSGAAEIAERRRFRRSAAGADRAHARAIAKSSRITSTASATCWSTSIRTPMSRNISGCA